MDIDKNIQQFIDGNGKSGGREPKERNCTFDYCFNYFQSFRKQNKITELSASNHIQMSCLQLAFYLASWGMFRGSSFLLEKNQKHFEDTIILISNYNKKIWEIDVDDYSENNVEILIDFKEKLITALGKKNKPTDTLITKIMLGVFANTPAFDSLFCRGFNVSTFSKKSLNILYDFYQKNKAVINKYSIYAFDFETGLKTEHKYTKAKIIDMIGFIEGGKRI